MKRCGLFGVFQILALALGACTHLRPSRWYAKSITMIAEEFVRKNGYTLAPGDPTSIVADGLEIVGDDWSAEKMALARWKVRRGQLESKARGIAWGREWEEFEVAVLFDFCKPDFRIQRKALLFMRDGSLGMSHLDFRKERVDEVFLGPERQGCE